MSSRKRRQQVREWQEVRQKEEALSTPRHFRNSIALTGIGSRELLIATLPSFERTQIWEVRRDPASRSLRLYSAISDQPDSEWVLGYQTVDVASAILDDLLTRFRSARLPLDGPAEDESAVADGTIVEVGLFGITSTCFFRWCQGLAPSQWADLAVLTEKAMELFRAAPTKAV